MAIFNDIKYSEIKSDRFDAEYYRKDYIENINLLNSTGEVLKFNRLFKYIKRGSQPAYSQCGSIKVLRSVNVGKMSFNETRQEYVDQKFFDSNIRGQVKKDDILITSTGVGTLGRVSIWPYDEKAYCDGHITILRNSEIDPYFMTVFLNTKFGAQQFDQNFRGSSGQIEIYPYDISKFIIPEFLLKYQKEIGDLLRRSFELQNQSLQSLKQANIILDKEFNIELDDSIIDSTNYISSFQEVINGRRLDAEYYNPEVKSILKKIKTFSHYRVKDVFFIKNGYPWNSAKFINDNSEDLVVRIRDIKPTFIITKNLTSLPYSYTKNINSPKGKPNDIVVGMDGVNYFYSSILEDDLLINQRVAHLVKKDISPLSSEYVSFIINSRIGQSQLLRDMTIASTVGHITNKNISNIYIPYVSEGFHSSITELVRNSINCKKLSIQLLEEAKKQVVDLIENQANQN
ncbi:hypothetical protein ACPDHL_12330 [Myroides sp. C15-4]|uniref:hypothetical protein n=1 Tax=Myroides sp. C15-4 TaxID=3400532 RepID=UPI003D2F7580